MEKRGEKNQTKEEIHSPNLSLAITHFLNLNNNLINSTMRSKRLQTRDLAWFASGSKLTFLVKKLNENVYEEKKVCLVFNSIRLLRYHKINLKPGFKTLEFLLLFFYNYFTSTKSLET